METVAIVFTSLESAGTSCILYGGGVPAMTARKAPPPIHEAFVPCGSVEASSNREPVHEASSNRMPLPHVDETTIGRGEPEDIIDLPTLLEREQPLTYPAPPDIGKNQQ